MALYKYKAKNEDGKPVSGLMEAGSEQEIYNRLRTEGLYLLEGKIAQKAEGRKLKARVLSEFNRSLGMLLASGISLVRALSILSQEETLKSKQRGIYEQVLRSVRQGTPLSDAMEEQGASFPPLMVHMYRSAEAGGSMDKVALRMAEHYEKEYRLKAKVSGAMVYPGILTGLIIIVIFFIFTFVLPQFEEMFAQMDSLPGITTFMMGISSGFKEHWLLLLVILIIVVSAVILILRIPPVALKKDQLKVRLPVFGKLLQVLYSARFARTLSSLYSAGLPMILALQISRNTVGNRYIEKQFEEVIQMVRAGQNLSDALTHVDGFVRKMVSSIMVGEETGRLDSILNSTADTLDYEAQMAINKMVSFMEPALIVIMAVIIGIVMVSVIAPIYGSYDAIEKSAYN